MGCFTKFMVHSKLILIYNTTCKIHIMIVSSPFVEPNCLHKACQSWLQVIPEAARHCQVVQIFISIIYFNGILYPSPGHIHISRAIQIEELFKSIAVQLSHVASFGYRGYGHIK